MRKLLFIFIGLATITIGTPVAIAGLIYTPNADIPTDLYDNSININDEMSKEIGNAIDSLEDNTTGQLTLGVSENTINRIIYASLKENIDDFTYAPGDDCDNDACKYIIVQDVDIQNGPSGKVGLLGVWADVYKETFVLNVYIDGLGYKTNAQIYLNFYDNPDYYEFRLEKIKLGNLRVPISAIRDLASFVLDKAGSDVTIDSIDTDLNNEIDQNNIPAEVSLENLNVKVFKDELADAAKQQILDDSGDQEQAQFAYDLINFLISYTDEQNQSLFSIGFFDGEDDNGTVGVSLNIGNFKYDATRDGAPQFDVDLSQVNNDLKTIIADNPTILDSNAVNEKINWIRELLITGYDNSENKYALDAMNLDVSSLGYTNISEIKGIINQVMEDNPSYYMQAGEEYDFNTDIGRMMYSSLDTIDTGLYQLQIDQEDLNRGLYYNNLLGGLSQSFIYPSSEDATQDEVATAGIEGIWIDFSNDVAQIKVLANINGYEMSGTISFEILDKFSTDDEFDVMLNDISFGDFTIPNTLLSSAFRLIGKGMDQGTAQYVAPNEQYPGGAIIFDYGTLDLAYGEDENLQFSITKDNIINQFGEDEALVKDVLEIIFDNDLINFNVSGSENGDGNITLSADVAKLESTTVTDIPQYLYDLQDENGFNPALFNVEDFMQDRVMSFIFNQVLSDSVFVLSESSINKMIYSTMNGLTDINTVLEYYNGTQLTTAEFGVKAIWFDLINDGVNNQIIINAFADFNGLPALISIETNITYTVDPVTGYNTEMQLEFSQITIGKDPGETEDQYVTIPIDMLLNLVGDSFDSIPFAQYDSTTHTITISADSISNMIAEGTAGTSAQDAVIEVVGISVENNEFNLNISYSNPAIQNTVDEYVAAVSSVTSMFVEGGALNDDLNTIFAPDSEDTPEQAAAKQEVLSLLTEISETILNPSTGTADVEDVTQLFDSFSSLDSQTQDEFIQLLQDNIDPSIFEGFDTSILGN